MPPGNRSPACSAPDHHLGVLHDALGIEHEHGPGENLEFVDEDAPVRAETAVHVVAAGPHGLDVLGAAEPVHGERQVETDRDRIDPVAEGGQPPVECLGLHLADGRVERRDDADQRWLAAQVGLADLLHAAGAVAGEREFRSRRTDLELVPDERERIALERHRAVPSHATASWKTSASETWILAGSIVTISGSASTPRQSTAPAAGS